jgi:hypothetical protein
MERRSDSTVSRAKIAKVKFNKKVIPGFLGRSIHHRGAEFAEIGEFLIKNSLLRVLRASAVRSPSLDSQESLKIQKKAAWGGAFASLAYLARGSFLKWFCSTFEKLGLV